MWEVILCMTSLCENLEVRGQSVKGISRAMFAGWTSQLGGQFESLAIFLIFSYSRLLELVKTALAALLLLCC